MIALVTDEATGADTPLGCAMLPEDKPYGCALTGSQGTGKCIGPDDLVLLEGRLIRAADAWDEYATSASFDGEGWWSEPLRWPLTCALDDLGRIVQAPVRRFYRQRVSEPGRRVTLSDGSQLTVTERHRLRGPDGWVVSTAVAEGDAVCVPRRLDWPGRRLPGELVELLAWQLTEGCERGGGRRASTTSTASITQADREVVEHARMLAQRVGELHSLRMNAMPIKRTKSCWTLFIHSADWRDFLSRNGYRWGAASADKRLPDFLMAGDLDSSRAFLRVFFAAEGHVNPSHLTLEASSASRLLLEQVRALLRRFGILAKLEPKPGRATNGRRIVRTYYRLRLAGPSLRTFLGEIGIAAPEKEARLIACLEGRRPNSNTEGVYARDLLTAARDLGVPFAWITPHSSYLDTPRVGRDKARAMADRLRAAADRIQRARADGHPLRAATRERTATLAAVNPAAVRQLADAFDARIDADVFYATVTRVEDVALDGWVYDFEVPGHHSFVAGGMLAHNTSVMAQSCADDAQDDECCLIVLDPKRDLADKALSVIPRRRRVWILDLADPEIGINPLLIPGRPDAVADAVVEGFRDTNEEGAIMASSDRYLRQAAIGALVLADEERRMPTMGDLYRLLLPHEDTMRRRVAELCDTHGELAFTSVFFGESLPTDLQDARSQTTVKLDAPRNKIEALLGVPSVNRMLHHPFQRSLHDIIAERDVLVVRGASGSIGEGNAIKVLTWLLRCLDAALSEQQQKPEAERVRVALKVDEAHLLLSPTFARMLAVHRSAGLEAMCAWQQLSQIKDLAVREATTNLLQNRIVFRMNNPEDARAEIGVMMSAYADVLHGTREARELTRFQPDMLVNLDVFYALCSWVAGGRRADAFVGRTIRPRENLELIAHHERAQRERGAFVVERLPNLVAPRSWVRRAAVVGIDSEAEEPTPERVRVEAAETSAEPGVPDRENLPSIGAPSQPAPAKAAASRRDGRASDAGAAEPFDAPAAASPPEPASQPRVRRVRIDDEPFDPARTGGGEPREVIDSQPIGTHISLERSYTELAIDKPLRLKYEPARSLADEKALARVDARARQILAALHDAGFLLAPQIGRRFWPDGTNERNIQRALTRMAELGLVERFKIISADGGTHPFIYQLTKSGFEYAQTQRGPHGAFIHPEAQWRERKVSDPRYVLHNLHATAWVLAFDRAAGRFVRAWHGPSHPVTRPRVPRIKEQREWVNLGPRHLKPPANMAIHGLRFPANVDVARQEFEGLEADALIELAIPAGHSTRRIDVFVEMDRTRRPSKNSPKFRRYDHFITGWSTLLDRYAEALKERPIVVFVCEDGDQALDFLKLADTQVTGAIGVKGTEIAEWQHPARERMFFVAERDLHSGTLRALRLPKHPPKVRAALGEPRDPQPEQVSILPRRLLGPSRRDTP